MKPEVSNFINYVKSECKKHNVKVDISPTKYLVLTEEGRLRVNGYFCGGDKILRVASGRPFKKWFPILVHEFAHFLQWKENSKAWKRGTLSNGKDTSEEMFAWVSGKKIPSKLIDEYINRTRDLELDCERKAHSLIKKFNLPLNAKQYAQQANAYVHIHNWLKIRRRWYKTGKAPYENPKIWKNLPSNLNGCYDEIPEYILELFDKHC